MLFKMDRRKVLLHGIRERSIREVKAAKLNKHQEDSVQLPTISTQMLTEQTEVQLCSAVVKTRSEELAMEVEKLIEEYKYIFDEPIALSPLRGHHDHRIPLIEGAIQVNQRSYCYAVHQKNEIDKMVQEFLSAGTIQANYGPYASLVVLVKKKDGSWRLCVDYRGFNNTTMKDKFHIPLIDDLMDELGGSRIYSKIDLRDGYHQVCKYPPDVHKTVFKTHSGHYVYTVMPFGLTNAPATFQGLMNSVFKELLRKGVLIFFL